MNKTIIIIIFCFTLFGTSAKRTNNNESRTVKLCLTGLQQIAQIDERYQSVNIEMCEVVGGDFWVPYDQLGDTEVSMDNFGILKKKILPIDLYQKKIRMLTSALAPMYIRVSGTWANTTYFQDNNASKLAIAPKGYDNVLTRAEWKGVIDFCKAVDGKLVTSFAISDGIRDAAGNWTPAQIAPLVNYTKSIGGKIEAAEMFNEPSHAGYGGAPGGYDADYYARDFAAFKSFINKELPEIKIMGPGSTGEGGILLEVGEMDTEKLLTTIPKPQFEIFSYHYYGNASKRCGGEQTSEKALTEEWLSKTESGLKYYEGLRNKYTPNAPIWLTETAESACGGNPWAATYIDCFRYLEQLGRLARKDVQVVMHNTLCASEYALLDQVTYEPRPNYWVALLWNKLMGTKVYDAGLKSENLSIYIHNSKKSTTGYSVLIVNPKDAESIIDIPVGAEQYLVTAEGDELRAKTIKLNGKILELTSDKMLPEIKGNKINAGNVKIPPYSIMFLSISEI